MWCKIKDDAINEVTGLGRLGDLYTQNLGGNVVAFSLYGIPRVKEEISHYSGDPIITTGRILGMALRNKIRSRDFMGNSSHLDFDYWCDLQTRLIGILTSGDGEDYVNRVWEALNPMIDDLSITMPFYILTKIIYSVRENEIYFVGDYASSGSQYVEIINKDFRNGCEVGNIPSITREIWPNAT